MVAENNIRVAIVVNLLEELLTQIWNTNLLCAKNVQHVIGIHYQLKIINIKTNSDSEKFP